jgi:hypothetical protein
MTKYNHAYTLGFSLESNHESGDDLTANQVRAAIIESLSNLSDSELLENLGYPFDTYEVEENA